MNFDLHLHAANLRDEFEERDVLGLFGSGSYSSAWYFLLVVILLLLARS